MSNTNIFGSCSDILDVIHVLRSGASLKIRDDDAVSRHIFDVAEHEVNVGKSYLSNQAPFSARKHLQAAVRMFRCSMGE